MPTLKKKSKRKPTRRKKSIVKNPKKKSKPKQKRRPKKLTKKEILKQKPFSDSITRKKEVNQKLLFAPIIFFILTLVTFGYTIYMPNGEYTAIMPSIGGVCFVLFVITFIYSMMKLNKC